MRNQKLGWASVIAIGCVVSAGPGCGVRAELNSSDAGLTSATGGASGTMDSNTGGQLATGGVTATGGAIQFSSTATGGVKQTGSSATGGCACTGGASSVGGTASYLSSTATSGGYVVIYPATGGMPAVSDAGTAPTLEIQASLMARWNQVVDSHPSNIDFHWVAFDHYIPPTFRFGTEEAYQTYAKLLLAFMQQSDNFDYLASNHLFDTRLEYVIAPGSSGWDSTFSEEVTYFASDAAFGNIDADTRAGLKQIADRIAQVQPEPT